MEFWGSFGALTVPIYTYHTSLKYFRVFVFSSDFYVNRFLLLELLGIFKGYLYMRSRLNEPI